MDKVAAARKRLYRALQVMRDRRATGQPPPNSQEPALFDYDEAALLPYIRRASEPERWARYLARFRYELDQAKQ